MTCTRVIQDFQCYKQEVIRSNKVCDFDEYIPDDDDDAQPLSQPSSVSLDESSDYPTYITQYILNYMKILLSNCAASVFDRRIDVVPLPKYVLRDLLLKHNNKYFGKSNENNDKNNEKNSNDQLRIKEFPSGNVKSLNVPLSFLWGWLNHGVPIESHMNDIVTKVQRVEFGWRRYKHHFYLILYLSKNDKDSKLQQTI